MVLPYVPMLAAGMVAVWRGPRGFGLDAFMLWDSFGIVTIVLLRQYISCATLRRSVSSCNSRIGSSIIW